MEVGLTAEAFASLLNLLGTDRERAGARYEDLRRTLIRFFEWRGAPFPEEHADETFDRVARRLDEGVDVKNVGAYCYTVAKLGLLGTRKGPEVRRVPLEPATLASSTDRSHEAREKEVR